MKKSKERIFYKEIKDGAYVIAFASIFPVGIRQRAVYHCLVDICKTNKVYESVFGRVKITIYKSPDNFRENGFTSLDRHVRDRGIPQSALEFELNGKVSEETYRELEKTLRENYAAKFNSWKKKYPQEICRVVEKTDQEKPKQEKPLRRKK